MALYSDDTTTYRWVGYQLVVWLDTDPDTSRRVQVYYQIEED